MDDTPMTGSDQLPATIRSLPRHPGTPPIETYRLAAEGCDVLFVVAPAGSGVALHEHDTDNVTVVVSGETTLTVNDQPRRIGPGEWYESTAGEPHAVHFDVDTVQIELRFRSPSAPSP